MSDFPDWSESEKDLFIHKLEELIHGPNPARKIGFIFVAFPIGESTRASVHSNTDATIVANVCFNICDGIMKTKGKLPYAN